MTGLKSGADRVQQAEHDRKSVTKDKVKWLWLAVDG